MTAQIRCSAYVILKVLLLLNSYDLYMNVVYVCLRSILDISPSLIWWYLKINKFLFQYWCYLCILLPFISVWKKDKIWPTFCHDIEVYDTFLWVRVWCSPFAAQFWSFYLHHFWICITVSQAQVIIANWKMYSASYISATLTWRLYIFHQQLSSSILRQYPRGMKSLISLMLFWTQQDRTHGMLLVKEADYPWRYFCVDFSSMRSH